MLGQRLALARIKTVKVIPALRMKWIFNQGCPKYEANFIAAYPKVDLFDLLGADDIALLDLYPVVSYTTGTSRQHTPKSQQSGNASKAIRVDHAANHNRARR
jgi:hypothetical protein